MKKKIIKWYNKFSIKTKFIAVIVLLSTLAAAAGIAGISGAERMNRKTYALNTQAAKPLSDAARMNKILYRIRGNHLAQALLVVEAELDATEKIEKLIEEDLEEMSKLMLDFGASVKNNELKKLYDFFCTSYEVYLDTFEGFYGLITDGRKLKTSEDSALPVQAGRTADAVASRKPPVSPEDAYNYINSDNMQLYFRLSIIRLDEIIEQTAALGETLTAEINQTAFNTKTTLFILLALAIALLVLFWFEIKRTGILEPADGADEVEEEPASGAEINLKAIARLSRSLKKVVSALDDMSK